MVRQILKSIILLKQVLGIIENHQPSGKAIEAPA